MFRKILLFAITFLIAFGIVDAQTKRYTNYSLNAGFDLNLNMHNADFQKLSGIPNCCTSFESAYGIGSNFFVGMEYLLNKNFMYGLKYSAQLSFSNMSATFSQNEFIGNDLLEDTYRAITVEHNLDANIAYLNIGQAVVLNPLEDLPLGVKFGFDVGFPISKTFEQSEKLLEPSDVFFTGGKKVRNEYSGDIPLIQNFYFALKAGVRYSVYKNDDFEVIPQLEYAHSFSNVTTAQNWAVNVLRLGVGIHYNIPKKDLPKPINPPTFNPEIPEIRAENAILAVNKFDVLYDGKEINPSSTIDINNYFVKNINSNPVPTLFFYSDNNAIHHIPVSVENEELSTKLAKFIKNNPIQKIEFIYYGTDDSENVRKKRIDELANKLQIEDFNITYSKISKKQLAKEEMADENNKIEVLIDNQKYFIDENSEILNAKTIYPNNQNYTLKNNFETKIDLKNDNEIADYLVELIANNNTQKLISGNNLKKGTNTIAKEFNLDLKNIDKFEVSYKINDADNQTISDKKEFFISKKDSIIETKYNEKIEENGKTSQQFIVAFFDFDNDKIQYSNKIAIEFIKNEIQNGKKIEIIAMTDNFGTEEYNIKLAEKRANSALKLLNISKESANITLKNGGIYNNSNPYYRILNRSVIVKIGD